MHKYRLLFPRKFPTGGKFAVGDIANQSSAPLLEPSRAEPRAQRAAIGAVCNQHTRVASRRRRSSSADWSRCAREPRVWRRSSTSSRKRSAQRSSARTSWQPPSSRSSTCDCTSSRVSCSSGALTARQTRQATHVRVGVFTVYCSASDSRTRKENGREREKMVRWTGEGTGVELREQPADGDMRGHVRSDGVADVRAERPHGLHAGGERAAGQAPRLTHELTRARRGQCCTQRKRARALTQNAHL